MELWHPNRSAAVGLVLPAPEQAQAFTGIEWLDRYQPGRQLLPPPCYFFAKRCLDLAVVLLLAPVLTLGLIVIGLAIRVSSPGAPCIFHQLRTGKGGRRFRMHKFRTMVPDAEELKKGLMHLNELQWPDFKITNDPRVTPLGRLLRKTSLDELPQLLNIVTGDMSLVGPRPTSFAPETYRLWHTERLDVMPGLTGLWQIIGRGEMEFDDRLRLDIAYIERRCLRLDIEILVRTALAVSKAKGAH